MRPRVTPPGGAGIFISYFSLWRESISHFLPKVGLEMPRDSLLLNIWAVEHAKVRKCESCTKVILGAFGISNETLSEKWLSYSVQSETFDIKMLALVGWVKQGPQNYLITRFTFPEFGMLYSSYFIFLSRYFIVLSLVSDWHIFASSYVKFPI